MEMIWNNVQNSNGVSFPSSYEAIYPYRDGLVPFHVSSWGHAEIIKVRIPVCEADLYHWAVTRPSSSSVILFVVFKRHVFPYIAQAGSL